MQQQGGPQSFGVVRPNFGFAFKGKQQEEGSHHQEGSAHSSSGHTSIGRGGSGSSSGFSRTTLAQQQHQADCVTSNEEGSMTPPPNSGANLFRNQFVNQPGTAKSSPQAEPNPSASATAAGSGSNNDAGRYFQRGRREREEVTPTGGGWRQGDVPSNKRARKERDPDAEADARFFERGLNRSSAILRDGGAHEDAPRNKRIRRCKQYDQMSNSAVGDDEDDLDSLDQEMVGMIRSESSPTQRFGKSTSGEMVLPSTFDDDRAAVAFNVYAKGGEFIGEESLKTMARDMGWPNQNASFTIWLWAIDRQTPYTERTLVRIRRRSWMETMAHLSVSHVRDALPALTEELREAYESHSPEFASYFKMVFAFMLVRDRSKDHRDFARTLEKETAAKALQRVIGHLSPFTSTFTAYLSSLESIKVVNMDQWTSFLTFSWLVKYPSVQGYSTKACWPVVLDDYVDWGINLGLLGASRPEEENQTSDSTPGVLSEIQSPVQQGVGDSSPSSSVFGTAFQRMTVGGEAASQDDSPGATLRADTPGLSSGERPRHQGDVVEETGSSSCGEPVIGEADQEDDDQHQFQHQLLLQDGANSAFFATRFNTAPASSQNFGGFNGGEGGSHRSPTSRWAMSGNGGGFPQQRPLGGSAVMCQHAYSAVGSSRRLTEDGGGVKDGGSVAIIQKKDVMSEGTDQTRLGMNQYHDDDDDEDDALPTCANNSLW